MSERDLMQDLDKLISWMDAYATNGGRVTPPKGLEILVILESCRNKIIELQIQNDILETERRLRNAQSNHSL